MTKRYENDFNQLFTEHPQVKECLELLKKKFSEENPLIVSDILDDMGHQYVNLVQKGGGMLGVAHAGYTYILEQMGIRYMKIAGTSAGAINSALLTAIGKKEDKKTASLINIMFSLNFFDIIDASPAARFFLKFYMTVDNFGNVVGRIFKWSALFVTALLVADLFIITARNVQPGLSSLLIPSFILTSIVLSYISVLFFFVNNAISQLDTSSYGINPGDFFYDWIKLQLSNHGVKTVSDLIAKAEAPIRGLRLRHENPHGLEGLKGSVTFIAADLVTQNKIEFPAMCKLFREDKDELNPALFVRASMSIPIFFEPFYITNIPVESKKIKEAWKDVFGVERPPVSCCLVDGGIISNFPINLFYDPKIDVPRLPTLSIDLDDTIPENPNEYLETMPIDEYLGRVLGTIKSYYDKEFLIRNKVFSRGIGKIPLSQFNWKNFFMTDEEKLKMLIVGAMAATDFLINFSWQDYKVERSNMQKPTALKGMNEIKPPQNQQQ